MRGLVIAIVLSASAARADTPPQNARFYLGTQHDFVAIAIAQLSQ